MENATTPTAHLDVNSYDLPEELVLGKMYYWRVDEVNESDETITKGLTWNFRITEYIGIDDFDSYVNTTELTAVWSDYWTNGTTSEIFIEKDPNFVIDGNSLLYTFGNAGSPYYAESRRIFSPSMDWVTGGVKALVLSFHGSADNDAERLYLEVTDASGHSAAVVYEDSNDLIQEQTDAWHEWNIELVEFSSGGVDLNDVNGIAIGFGDKDTPVAGGSGRVYFENIRLYPTRCRSELTRIHGDFDGDCTINGYDMEIMAQAWLISDSEVEANLPGDLPWVWYKFDEGAGTIANNSGTGGSGLNGTFKSPTDPTWVSPGAPAIGSEDPNWALDFGGLTDRDNVEIPVLNLNSNTVTISAWIKGAESQISWAGIVFTRDPDANSVAGLSIGEEQTLAYHWNDENWGWDSGLVVPDNEWIFVAVVVEPTQAMMYMSDGITYSFATNIVDHDIEEFDGLTYVGWDYETGSADRFFNGLIDDVRIYTRALDMGEVMGLSGLTGMQYLPLPLETVSNIVIKDPPGGPYDSGNPDIVNFRDYCIVADNWLAEILWP